MSSIFFKRLEGKYNTESIKGKIKGKKYEKVINEILAHNTEKIAKTTLRLSNTQYQKSIKKLKRAKTVKLPNISEVLPKKSVFLIKGAENGKLLSQTLRIKLQRDLRNI